MNIFQFIDKIAEIHWFLYFMLFFIIFLIVIALIDVNNKKHTIKHNFPVIGHIRYFLESIGPELRQYIVANNREELPFNRSQRTWIYASAKKQNNYAGFGTDKDLNEPGYIFINPSLIPYPIDKQHINYMDNDPDFLPCAKVIGHYHKRKRPFRPYSLINISAMSFGSLSSNAILALNKGAKKIGCYHNTGEGGYSPYHDKGADVVFQIGTSYFGIRTPDGNLSIDKLIDLTKKKPNIRSIEIKLSQGAKPGKGGVLPASKITKEIAEIRDITLNQDVISPPYHKAFNSIESMVEIIEEIADKTGLPVGIKAAVGKLNLWHKLCKIMQETDRGPDFITIDGGEGGTGAAPPSFADNMALPFVYGFGSIYKLFQEYGLTDRIVFIGSGKLGFPASTIRAMAMGVDIINVAREAMLSIGCIQAQACQNNTCPTGIATQNKWLRAGLDPEQKSDRFYNYIKHMRKEVLEITHSCGYEHPSQLTMNDVSLSMGDNNKTKYLQDIFDYEKTPVNFVSMQEVITCKHLGALKI